MQSFPSWEKRCSGWPCFLGGNFLRRGDLFFLVGGGQLLCSGSLGCMEVKK